MSAVELIVRCRDHFSPKCHFAGPPKFWAQNIGRVSPLPSLQVPELPQPLWVSPLTSRCTLKESIYIANIQEHTFGVPYTRRSAIEDYMLHREQMGLLTVAWQLWLGDALTL